MSNQIAVINQPLQEDYVKLVKALIAKDATDQELQLFLHQCQRTGLDALSKQIYAISRFSKKDNRKVMSIQVSIDGARLIAQRTGQYDSQEGPYWCGEDGQWVDVWLGSKPPRAAKVLVYKVGSVRGTTGIAHWSEYADTASNFWQGKPALMLAKCAEMLALRKAFPQELSGLYAQEEMPQVEAVIEATGKLIDASTGEIHDEVEFGMGQPAENPFEDEPPAHYTNVFNQLTGEEYDAVNWIRQLHRKGSPCSEKQYQFLTSVVDAITNGQHRFALSVLCQSEISGDNPPSELVASALFKFLQPSLTVKDENGKAVKDDEGKVLKEPNPKYSQKMVDAIANIAKQQQPELVAVPA